MQRKEGILYLFDGEKTRGEKNTVGAGFKPAPTNH
jgi:hypothetical protein